MSEVRGSLPVAVAQPPCDSHDVAANAVAHADAVRSAGARVVVFPELSLTGYELHTAPLAADDPRLTPLVSACAEAGSVALVGAPLRDGPHIAVLAVDGAGVSVAYRKIWLAETESARFVPGDRPAVLEVDGWRFGLAVCRDTGIPQHAADTAALGMDAYVAGIVESAAGDTVPDDRARRIAVDQDVWVAVASFARPHRRRLHRRSRPVGHLVPRRLSGRPSGQPPGRAGPRSPDPGVRRPHHGGGRTCPRDRRDRPAGATVAAAATPGARPGARACPA